MTHLKWYLYEWGIRIVLDMTPYSQVKFRRRYWGLSLPELRMLIIKTTGAYKSWDVYHTTRRHITGNSILLGKRSCNHEYDVWLSTNYNYVAVSLFRHWQSIPNISWTLYLKFITLFNQIHMHPHHLHMVPLNAILPVSLRYPKLSLLKTQPTWPIIICKIWISFQKKNSACFFHSGLLRQGHMYHTIKWLIITYPLWLLQLS
jgi:hypothetical protein